MDITQIVANLSSRLDYLETKVAAMDKLIMATDNLIKKQIEYVGKLEKLKGMG